MKSKKYVHLSKYLMQKQRKRKSWSVGSLAPKERQRGRNPVGV